MSCISESIYSVVFPVDTMNCTQGFMDLNLIKKKASEYSQLPVSRPLELSPTNETRWVFPGLGFNCTAKLLGVTLGVRVRGIEGVYPHIELWQNTLGITYSLMSSIPIELDAHNFTTNSVYYYKFEKPLFVTSGYILGFRQPNGSNSTVSLFYNESSQAQTSYSLKDISDQRIILNIDYVNKWRSIYPLIHPDTSNVEIVYSLWVICFRSNQLS